MGETLEVTKGLRRDFDRQYPDENGTAYTAGNTPFLSTDTLTCTVWPGGELASVATPTVAWIDADLGTYRISFVAANTSSLRVGTYQYEVTVARGGTAATLERGRVDVQGKAGTDTNALAFTTIGDLRRYCPWIEDLQTDVNEFGFADEQIRATNRLIDQIVSLWKPGYGGAVSPITFGGAWTYGTYDSPSRWLREQLIPLEVDSTPPADMTYRTIVSANYIDSSLSTALLLYDEVKEICARRAIGYVLASQIGCNNKMEWDALSARFHTEARALFLTRRFEIDLADPQTGQAGIVIDGGNTSLR